MPLPEGYSIESIPEDQTIEQPVEQQIRQPDIETQQPILPEGYSIESIPEGVEQQQEQFGPRITEEQPELEATEENVDAFMDQLYSGGLPQAKQNAVNELIRRGVVNGATKDSFSASKLNNKLRKRALVLQKVLEEKALERGRPLKEVFSEVARPIVSGITSVIGGIAGTPAAPLAGSIAGGALGYGIGEKGMDIIDNFLGLREPKPLIVEMGDAGLDVAEGVVMEVGGQLVATGIGGLAKGGKKAYEAIGKKLKPITTVGAKEKAGRVLAADTSSGPIIANNIDDALALQDEIPGLQFSRGQLTNDPEIIKFERAIARKPGEAAKGQLDAEARNSKALRDYIDKRKGVEGIGEVTEALSTQKEAAEKGIEIAKGTLKTEAGKIEGAAVAEDIGETIRGASVEAQKAAKVKAGEMFKDLPDVEIDGSSIVKKIKDLSKPMSRFEDVAENIPKEFKFFKDALEETKGAVIPSDLQGLRESLTDSIRDLKGAASPNNRKISRLTGLLKEVDNVLETAPMMKGIAEDVTAEAIAAGKKLKTARKFYREEVVKKYGQGAMQKILKKGSTGDKVSNANVAGTFFKPGFKGTEAAKEFVSAVGDNKNARGALEDYINQDLLSSVTNPSTKKIVESKLKTWQAKYKPALKELGLENRFDSLTKASQELTKAKEMKVAFDKSVATKLLKSDVDKSVKNAFASGSKGQAARDLMNNLKGNKKAISGLQNATIDHITKRAELTKPDAFDNPIISMDKVEKAYKEFKPALDVLFKDSPAKLKALDNYRSALKTMQRGKASPLGSGSDTVENAFSGGVKAVGDIVLLMSAASGYPILQAGAFAKTIHKHLAKIKEKEINSLLNRASFDPDVAYSLMSLAKGVPFDKVKQRLYGQILSAGGVVSKKMIEDEEKEKNKWLQ